MRTPDQCRAKAEDLEREAGTSKSDVRRKALLDLAENWRRLAAPGRGARGTGQCEAPVPWTTWVSRAN